MEADPVISKVDRTLTREAIRYRILLELVVLAALTVGFLYLFPQRATVVNIGLALLAMLMILLNRRYTREVVWGCFPPEATLSARRLGSARTMGLFTLTGVLLMAVIGIRQVGLQGLLTPALLLYFVFRGSRDRDWLKRWGERFGDFNAT